MFNKPNLLTQKPNIMQKFLRTLMLVALMLVPFASQAQGDCTPISTYPVTYGFEASEGFTTTVTAAAACTTNVFNACWRNEQTTISGSTGSGRIWHIYGGTTTSQIHGGAHSLMLPDKGSSSAVSTTMLVFPAMSFTSNYGYVVSFWIYRSGTSSNPEGFKMYVSNTDTIDANAVELGHYSRNYGIAYPVAESASGWYQYETAPITMTGTVYLIFEGQSYYGSSTYVDDVVIEEILPCSKVTDLAVSTTTSNSITLTWVDAANNGATYIVSDASGVIASGITATTYTVTNLNSNTEYTFSVTADCGNDGLSGVKTVTGRTACGVIGLPYTCGFEVNELQGNSSNAERLPWCWTRYASGTGSYTYYPYSNTSYVHEGSRALYFYCGTSTSYPDTQVVILPEVDVQTYPMNGNRVTFWARMSSASYSNTVYVGTVTDPTDPSTFVPVGTVQVSGNVHTKYAVPMTAAAGSVLGPYVAIVSLRNTTAQGYMTLDDLTLEEMPACLEVSDVAASNITSSSMSLTWSANANNASATYTVYNMADTSVVASNLSGTTYTVTNLTPNTQYTFGVQANCPAGDAAIMTVTGRTDCAVEVLPFTEDFSATLANDPCWRGATGTTADQVFSGTALTLTTPNWTYASSVNSGIAAGHYYKNIYGTSCKSWIITPAIDLSTVTSAQLSFDAVFTGYNSAAAASGFESNSSQVFMVIVSADGGNTWLETNATKWQNENGNYTLASLAGTSYINQVINLNQFIGDTIKIAFYAQSTTSGGDNNLHIDNIAVTEVPSCLQVSGLTANATHNSVTLTWSDADNTGATYTVYNGTEVVATGITAMTYTIDSLTSQTDYVFGVVANCSADDASSMVTIAIRTSAEPIMCGDVEATAYDNFDTITGTTSYFPGYSLYEYSYSEVIVPAARLVGLGEIKGMQFNVASINSGSSNFNNCEVYLMHTTATSLTNGFIQDATNMQLVYTGDLSQIETGWQTVTFMTPFTWNGTDNLLVAVRRNDGNWASSGTFASFTTTDTLARYIYQDGTAYTIGSITGGTPVVNIPAYRFLGCPMVEPDSMNVFVAVNDSSMGSTTPAPGMYTLFAGDSIVVTATANNGYQMAAWVVSAVMANGIYTDTIFADDDEFANPITLSLTEESEVSEATIMAVFEAEPVICYTPSMTIDSVVGRDMTFSWTTNAAAYAVEVILFDADGEPVFDTTYGPAGTQTLHFDETLFDAGMVYVGMVAVCGVENYSDMVMDSVVISDPAIECNTTCNVTIVGADSYGDGWNGNAINIEQNNTVVGTFTLESGSSYTASYSICGDYPVNFTWVAGDYPNETSFQILDGGNTVAYTGAGTSSMATGDVIYTMTGACPSCLPAVVTVENVAETSVTISWTGNAASYNVYSDSTLVASVTGNDSTYTFSGLTANTSYVFGVEAVCSATDVANVVTVNVTTPCAAITLPYTETFEETSATRACWSTDGPGTWQYGYYANTGALYEGSAYAYIRHAISGNVTKLISPVFSVSADATGLQLDFAHIQKSWSGDQDEMRVYYRTSSTGNWVMVAEYTNDMQSWTVESVVVPANTYQVAFEMTDGYGYGVAVDSVVVTELTAAYCYAVTGLTATPGAYDVTLSWSDDNNTGATYTIINIADSSVVATGVTGNNYVVTGLNPETSYYFAVVTNCDANNASDAVAVAVTTIPSCPAPTNLTVSLTPGNGTVAELAWTAGGQETAWQICLNGDTNNLIDVTTNPYTLTNLTAEQAYTAKVRAYCDATDQSYWSNTVNFTPTNAFSLTIADGTATNSYVPVYGFYADAYLNAQFMYPGTMLAAISGQNLTQMTFYASQSSVNWGNANYKVYLAETTDSAVSAFADVANMTLVYDGSLGITDNEMVVNFTDEYVYGGGNLLVAVIEDATGSYVSCTWYGVETTGASVQGYSYSSVSSINPTQRNFMPKVKINYAPAPACARPTDVTVDYNGGTTAIVSWTSNASSFNLSINGVVTYGVTANPDTITGLDLSTTYTIMVQANCGTDTSAWSLPTSFSTTCAVISSFPYTEDFTVAPTCWNVIDADGDGYNWELIAGAVHSASYDNNVGALTPDNWLVTPQFQLAAGTNYEVTWNANPQDTNWPSEHYGLYVSTTTADTAAFTLLQEWTLTSAGNVPVVSLNNYAGQTIYLAFRHWNCTDWFRIAIDNFQLREAAGANQVTVTLTQNNPMYGSVAGGGVYTIGDSVTVSATATAGYHFVNWVSATGATVSSANPYTFVATSDVTLQAIFAQGTGVLDSMKVTVAVNNATMGTTNPAPGVHYFYEGQDASVVAIANTGYHLEGWSIYVTSDGDVLMDTTVNTAVTDVFDLFGGWTVESGDGDYEWTVTANFAAGAAELDTVTVNITVTNPVEGTTNPAPGTHYFTTGDVLSVVALPNTGYVLAGWTLTMIDNTGDTVYGNMTIPVDSADVFSLFTSTMVVGPQLDGYVFDVTPVFMLDTNIGAEDSLTVILAVNDATMGTTNPVPGTYVYGVGDSLIFTALPNDGYHVENIIYTISYMGFNMTDTLDATVVSVSEVVDSNMLGAVITVLVNFAADSTPQPVYWTVELSANDDEAGSVSPAGISQVLDGASFTATATANEGYYFSAWVSGQTVVSEDAVFTFTVSTNISLVAVFLPDSVVPPTRYHIVGEPNDPAMGEVSGSGYYEDGEVATLIAIAHDGYRFVRWSTGETTDTIYITVDGEDVTVTAIFEVNTGSIEDADADDVTIYSTDSKIVVRGAEGSAVYVFDVNGRLVSNMNNATETVEFRMANTGVYLVKVGAAPAKRVLVVR